MTSLAETNTRFSLSPDARLFVNWALVWVVFANIGFMALWFSGAPPRHFQILLAGFVGLMVKRLPFPLQFITFIGVMGYSLLVFIGGLFNLSVSSLVYSLQFFAEIKPAGSIEYIVAAVAILFIMVAAYRVLKRGTNFESPLFIILGAIGFFSIAATDIYLGKDMRGHYFREAPEGALFESAREKSGFAANAVGKRHLILVMVESLGVPHENAEMSRKLFGLYEQKSVTDRYETSSGTSLYYNSTTAGEIRELCGRWGDYYEIVDAKDESCLPSMLAKKGYGTQAMHSFQGPFFKRNIWYPNVGFESQEFAEELQKRGARECGGVFPGACDRDIPKMMAENLKKADGPQFLYWLTVNSHLPVPPGKNLNVENCERVSPVLAEEYPMICRQFSIWDDVDTALIAQITAEDFPEADILIVGDHMPPYFDRHHRTQFDPERVPWLYLKHKDKIKNETGPSVRK